ncbi:hypothetical protein CRG98_042724 [Punica granatum]|uniref:TF-B3 domain-containing protein n=1 Tax=Punica granatum TaxID=22663 RepID=A0A2I0HYV0_PUNGR|nr:hypothetical protein CRG98_042724 [Punica granatum]
MAFRTPQMEDGQSTSFDLKAPHFFKIILHSTIQSGKLVIPKKFVRKYGAELSKSNVVRLKVPSGDAWEVELRREDGAVWLENGWMDFVNFYSVKHGDFLVFWYKSRSSNEFDVVLFDKSATEIEYPLRSQATLSPIKVEEINDDEDHVIPSEMMEDLGSSSRITRRTSHLLTGNDSTDKNYVPSKTLVGAKKVKALERAKMFKSSNPYFPVVMQPYYVHPPYELNVPGRFVQRYMDHKGSSQLKLYVSGDKIWTVRCKSGVRRGQVKAKVLGRGWKAFVVDNGLVLGDVCVFESIRGLRSISFKVTIFRAPQPAKSCTVQLQGEAAFSRQEGGSGAKFEGKEKDSSLDMKQDFARFFATPAVVGVVLWMEMLMDSTMFKALGSI